MIGCRSFQFGLTEVNNRKNEPCLFNFQLEQEVKYVYSQSFLTTNRLMEDVSKRLGDSSAEHELSLKGKDRKIRFRNMSSSGQDPIL